MGWSSNGLDNGKCVKYTFQRRNRASGMGGGYTLGPCWGIRLIVVHFPGRYNGDMVDAGYRLLAADTFAGRQNSLPSSWTGCARRKISSSCIGRGWPRGGFGQPCGCSIIAFGASRSNAGRRSFGERPPNWATPATATCRSSSSAASCRCLARKSVFRGSPGFWCNWSGTANSCNARWSRRWAAWRRRAFCGKCGERPSGFCGVARLSRRTCRSPATLARTRRHVDRQLEELFRHQASLADAADRQGHHAMRIAAKRLRYTLEIVRPRVSGAAGGIDRGDQAGSNAAGRGSRLRRLGEPSGGVRGGGVRSDHRAVRTCRPVRPLAGRDRLFAGRPASTSAGGFRATGGVLGRTERRIGFGTDCRRPCKWGTKFT